MSPGSENYGQSPIEQTTTLMISQQLSSPHGQEFQGGYAVPQPPQLSGSAVTSTHSTPHCVRLPQLAMPAPLTHGSFPQSVPHFPQFFGPV